MDKKYIIANWKENMGFNDLVSWVDGFSGFIKFMCPESEVILAPSLPFLPIAYELSKICTIKIAAQDISLKEKGANTGETGVLQIKEFCKYAIIGHSERKEDIETVIQKRDLCLKEGITPIVCFINPQDLPRLCVEGVIIAWEDPKNISKDGVYSAEDPGKIAEIAKEIRKIIPETIPLVYGGSVNENNIENIAKIPELDGVLVGNASLDPKTFADIIGAY
jgi:triosephosphate isomerase